MRRFPPLDDLFGGEPDPLTQPGGTERSLNEFARHLEKRTMGKRIECIIEHDVDVDQDGRALKGVRATCTCCDAVTEAWGTGGNSVRRCLAMMREECEQGEDAYFYADDGSDND